MIDHTLLTKENGFEDGVVVEIVWDDDEDHRPWLTRWPIFALSGLIPIRSIRPLTGPMSIWNHIPDGVEAILRHPGGITFYFDDPGKEDDHRIVYRPFWAKAQK